MATPRSPFWEEGEVPSYGPSTDNEQIVRIVAEGEEGILRLFTFPSISWCIINFSIFDSMCLAHYVCTSVGFSVCSL